VAPSGVAKLGELLRRYPLAVSGVFLFSLFMTFVYSPFDFLVKPLFQPIAQAQEVWFGFMLRGWAAKLTEPLHWLIYAALSYGFFQGRPWAWTLGALYTLQVAVGMVVWIALYTKLGGAPAAGVGLLFTALAVAVWRARPAQLESR
jgi:hypothetical protein